MRTPNALRGMVRFWLFDLGSASFLGTALLALIMMLALITGSKQAAIPIALGMIQISISAAIAWQFNRLTATEWASLVPNYSDNIALQSLLLGAIATSISLAACLLLELEGGLDQVMLATLAGVGFIYYCRRHINGFYLSFFLFLLLPFIAEITDFLPDWVIGLVPFLTVILAYLTWREIRGLRWHSDARTVYLNGLEMGWFWLPSLGSSRLMSYFDKLLHPVNFFLGPMLSTILIAMPVLALLVTIGNSFSGMEFPVLFVVSQFSAVTCTMVHWSRIQRWRSVETLYILPGFDGKQGLIEAFANAQYRLLALITLIMAVLAALVCWLNPEFTFVLWSHIVLSTFCACCLLLGFGCAAKGAMHITLSMLVVVFHSAWLSSSLVALRDGEQIISWLFVDIGLVAFSVLTLWWGKKKLWNGDLC